MEIKLNEAQAKQLLGNLIFIGSTIKYKYDKATRTKTEEIECSIVEIASDKLGKTLTILSNDKELSIAAFSHVELIDLIYNPYSKAVSANFAELIERFSCSSVVVKGGMK